VSGHRRRVSELTGGGVQIGLRQRVVECVACTAAVKDLSDINQMLTRSVAPALVGGPLVLAGYLAAKHLPAASTVAQGGTTVTSVTTQSSQAGARRLIGVGRTKLLAGVAIVAGVAAIVIALLASGNSPHKAGSGAQSPSARPSTSLPAGQAVGAPLVRTVQVQVPSSAKGSVLFQVPSGWSITTLTSSPDLPCVPSADTGTCPLVNAVPGTYTFTVTVQPPAAAPASSMTVTYQAGQVKVVQHDPI
jgi:hypothetical protein